MTENYRQAALRHYLDAELLTASARYDNAGHLIGFAAECAIKSVLSTGSLIPDEARTHLPKLANISLKHVKSRAPLHIALHAVLRCAKDGFFDDWRVSSRYDADGHVSREVYAKWKKLTESSWSSWNKAAMTQPKTMPIMRFDNALPALVLLARDHFGEAIWDHSLVLRDAAGRLTLVLRAPVSQEERYAFDAAARERLGAYVDGPSATPDELFDPSLENDTEVLTERVTIKETELEIRLVDRRIVGQDWNRPDFRPAAGKTPIVTFFSCKGRSTALAVAAASLSDRGKKVLIVDLDLEAPGLGPIFLPPDNLPDYGALDYFVENGLGGVDDAFLEACLASSPITAGRGLVEVVPSVGRIGQHNPQNVLPKLGRAFIDDPNGSDGSVSFRDQARTLIRSLAERRRYDAILVDARSGLSENAAAVVVGLGGSVLLFGVDTPQTFDAYDYLLAHLGRFVPLAKPEDDWRDRLRMVHAKAARGLEAWARFRNRAQELFERHLYEEAGPEDFDAFNFDFDDEDAPHYAWPIPYDADYAEFDPLARREQLSRDFFDRSFGPFTDHVWKMIFETAGQSGD